MSIKSRILSLISAANAATGGDAEDLTSAVAALIAAGAEAIQGGAFIPVNNVTSYTVEVVGEPKNAVCFLQTPLSGTPGYRWVWLAAQSELLNTGYRGSTSTNGGSMSGVAAETVCTFGDGTVTFDGGTGYFVGGEVYVWIAY